MRLLIALRAHNHADVACSSGREGKRILNEQPVSTLMISSQIEGRDSGLDILRWAKQRQRLPWEVILVDSNRQACQRMGEYLSRQGYRTANDRQYLKLR